MKKKWIAILLSFIFSGLGQIYAGSLIRGIVFAVLSVIAMICSQSVSAVFSLVFLAIWGYGMIDAAQKVTKANLAVNSR
ncbi:hypothetical protein [Paenibacillus sp. PL91]|uniref:hypothetical protein n=1 Tax=Paenibacillus sp. PL91 TaxID=2729538 RepID=UPI00145DBADE|nr:hypothetical protein [Paenibacillus sp. PL91]MBC9201349.1 hypothetical protein [Paenibacillus sp. PL91]